MSVEERKQILQMVADGKISAEEAAKLMRALDEPAEEEIQVIPHDSNFRAESNAADPAWDEKPHAPEFEQVKKRAKRFAQIPLWIGIITTVLFSWWMFSIQQNHGLNFWFFCLSMPLMFSILLIVMGAGGQTSRWIYVNVDRTSQHDWPRHITLALPLPLGLVSWFLRTFGEHIEGLKQTAVDEILMGISMAKNITDPLIVNVDESDEGGERVQVFIG
jgi:anti-sigma factor RsiW